LKRSVAGEQLGAVVPRSFYDRDPLEVAPELLGKLLVRGERRGRIVEVEAYRGESDPASHAFGGLRPRCATMFGPAGHLYVYFTYGMHYCSNVVCLPDGIAGAVLLRALAAVAGEEAMIDSRLAARSRAKRAAGPPAARRLQPGDPEMLSGPARLCQGFGIDRSFDGIDLSDPASEVVVVDDGTPPPLVPATGPRVGLGQKVGRAAELPWRFWVTGDRHVSAGAGQSRR
jgi:DNA-3-methyladenine glycosylase